MPAAFPNGGSLVPPATDANSYLYWNDRRICPHYCTAMACIILQMPNNYLPILQR